MVGTARAADLSIFIKKVGYSVGLEDLQKRAMDFAQAYASNPSFRLSTWSKLVHEKWNLKSDHIADVFAALEIVRIANKEPIAGNVGEALGICARQLSGDSLWSAVRYLVTLTIVQHDGDIFLNALQASFNENRFVTLLMDALSSKRGTLFELFSAYPEREAITRAIRIDRQKTNQGSAAAHKGLMGATAGRPLSTKINALRLGLPRPADLDKFEPPSLDYVAKVLVTRRGWAETLGLFGSNGITASGTAFLTSLSAEGYGSAAGYMLVWPTRFEIESARFDPANFQHLGLKETTKFHRDVLEALSAGGACILLDSSDAGEFVARVFHDFQELAQNRAMIRNELPLAVLSAVAAARAHATGVLIDYDSSRTEANSSVPKVSWRRSQAVEEAITVRRQ